MANRWYWLEAELGKGVMASPLSKYATHNTRICRPIGLSLEDRVKVVRFAVERVGHAYDVKNIIDLCGYFLLQALAPALRRRCVIALGSREPTRAMCSSLIAQAFEAVNYPILPAVELADERTRARARALKFCTPAIIHSTHRGTSISRHFSPS